MGLQIEGNPAPWYCASGSKRSGPFTNDQLKSLASTKIIRPDDLLWHEGMEKWEAARSVKGLFSEQRDDLNALLAKLIGPPGSINLRSVAIAQKLLIITIAGYLPIFIFWQLLFIVIPLQLAALAALCITLKSTVARTLAVVAASCIPHVGVIPLLWANQRGIRVLTEHDVTVGFWGVRWRNIPESDHFVSLQPSRAAS